MIEKKCRCCYKVFGTKEQPKKYCSNACKTRYYRRKKVTL